MYKNLQKILSEKRITMKAFAEFLGVAEKTAQKEGAPLAGAEEGVLAVATA